jgi:hypothetical protein
MFRQSKVRSYMLTVLNDHTDKKTGEVNATTLAEDAASHFNQNHIGGPLDDETHWLWDLAAELSERYSK